MSRVALAFLVAPLWVPLAFAIFAGIYLFHGNILSGWFVYGIVVSMVPAYAGSVAFGLPAFRFLQRRQLVSPWIGAGCGFVIGVVTFYASSFLIPWLSGAFKQDGAFERALLVPSYMLLSAGGLGVLVGLTIWFITRPDKR
jgi:hypothetical protein